MKAARVLFLLGSLSLSYLVPCANAQGTRAIALAVTPITPVSGTSAWGIGVEGGTRLRPGHVPLWGHVTLLSLPQPKDVAGAFSRTTHVVTVSPSVSVYGPAAQTGRVAVRLRGMIGAMGVIASVQEGLDGPLDRTRRLKREFAFAQIPVGIGGQLCVGASGKLCTDLVANLPLPSVGSGRERSVWLLSTMSVRW